jgi:kinetochor protein Mis14/NSL1
MTEISLDSHKDVQFLKSNISLATREKLDTHLPPTAVPNIHADSLRKRVEEMLDEVYPDIFNRLTQFVSRTFEMASSSLLINGLKPSISSLSEQQDMEPFDADLLARVQALHREIEQKTLEVTSLRRSTPLEAATILQKSYSETTETAVSESAPDVPPLSPIEMAREDEIKQTYTQGMKLLKDLKKGVPATTAKLERAKEVVTHVYS